MPPSSASKRPLCTRNDEVESQASASGRTTKSDKQFSGNYVNFGTYGTGIEDGITHSTRYNHIKYCFNFRGGAIREIVEIVGVLRNHKGITFNCKVPNSDDEIFRVEHHDLWYFYNGPEAFMDYYNANYRHSKSFRTFVTNPKVVDFVEAISDYCDDDHRNVGTLIQARRAALEEEYREKSQCIRLMAIFPIPPSHINYKLS